VTEGDWETLGKAALEALDLDLANKSFARLKDLRYLELITDMADKKKAGTEDDQSLLADVHAFQVRLIYLYINIHPFLRCSRLMLVSDYW
jgi:intraflagellar transport protein 122